MSVPIEPDYSPTGNVKWMYDRLQEQIKEKEDYKDKLSNMENRYLTLTHNFSLHMKICKSEDWRGGI